MPTSGYMASMSRGFNATWPHLVLFTVYISYLFAGGGLFLFLEGAPFKKHTDEVARYGDLRMELDEAIRNASRDFNVTAGNLADLWDAYLLLEDTLEICDFSTLDWTFTGSVLFCVTTIATIGYGDAVPITPVGRAMIVLYSLVGIPLTLTFLADIGGLLARVVIFVVSKFQCRRTKRSRATAVEDVEKAPKVGALEPPPQRDRPSTRSALSDDGNLMDLKMSLGIFQDSSDPVRGSRPNSRRNSVDEEISELERAGSLTGHTNFAYTKSTNERKHPAEETKTAHGCEGVSSTNAETGEASKAEHREEGESSDGMKRHVPVAVVLGILAVYTFVGALMIAMVENWNYGDALYFTFITLTTIGFGDFVPVKHYMDIPSFVGCMVYTVCGLSVMSMCLALVQAKVVMLMSRVAAKVGF